MITISGDIYWLQEEEVIMYIASLTLWVDPGSMRRANVRRREATDWTASPAEEASG